MNKPGLIGLRRIAFAGMLAAGLAFFTAGCEDDNEYGGPPAGLGRLVIENNTTEDIRPYVDGFARDLVENNHSRSFDLEPGEHRVVLDQKGGTNAATAFDVDALAGRVMIADVHEDYSWATTRLRVDLRIQ